MTLKEACEAMLAGKRFRDQTRDRVVWISAVECRGSVEISYGDDDRPRAVWLWLNQLNLTEAN